MPNQRENYQCHHYHWSHLSLSVISVSTYQRIGKNFPILLACHLQQSHLKKERCQKEHHLPHLFLFSFCMFLLPWGMAEHQENYSLDHCVSTKKRWSWSSLSNFRETGRETKRWYDMFQHIPVFKFMCKEVDWLPECQTCTWRNIWASLLLFCLLCWRTWTRNITAWDISISSCQTFPNTFRSLWQDSI